MRYEFLADGDPLPLGHYAPWLCSTTYVQLSLIDLGGCAAHTDVRRSFAWVDSFSARLEFLTDVSSPPPKRHRTSQSMGTTLDGDLAHQGVSSCTRGIGGGIPVRAWVESLAEGLTWRRGIAPAGDGFASPISLG